MKKSKKIPLAEGLYETETTGHRRFILVKIPEWTVSRERSKEHLTKFRKALGIKKPVKAKL